MNGRIRYTLAAGHHFEISGHAQNTSPLLGEISDCCVPSLSIVIWLLFLSSLSKENTSSYQSY